jgi:hypothetical protein
MLSYIDDTLLFLTTKTFLGSLSTSLHLLGHPLGIHLNTTKTEVLTQMATHDSANKLTSSQYAHLQQALAILDSTDSKLKEGTRLLGASLGSPAFTSAFLTKAAQNFAQCTKMLSCPS